MSHLSSFVLLGLLAGCPKTPPAAPEPTPAPAPAPAENLRVEKGADLAGAAGVRAVVTGRLETVDTGTAIVLSDGVAVFVTNGAPPDGWDWLVGSQVRVQGMVYETAPTGSPVPWLAEPEAPMPADVEMGLGLPQ